MIFLTMMIFLKKGKEDVFHQFEELAIPLLKDHKGRLLYRLRPTRENYISFEDELELPYEIHFLSFETENDFLNFSKDKRRANFLHLKEASISSSFLVKGNKL
jgi:hypothetical protein